jgi:hypothetical protein
MEEVFVVEEGEIDRRFFCVLWFPFSITGGASTFSFPVTATVAATAVTATAVATM